MKHFAGMISEQRKKKNMTQEELASRLNITPQAVSKWENGVGLPDVTLFPLLSQILDISMERLFGMEERRSEVCTLPPSYLGMPLVCENDMRGCYSGKDGVRFAEGVAEFADGSRANLLSGEVVNCGAGEIRFLLRESFVMPLPRRGNRYEHPISDCRSLKLRVGCPCVAEVRAAEHGETPQLCATGSELFTSSLICEEADGLLTVRVGQQPNRQHLSGFGDDNRLELILPVGAGEKLDLAVNGCGACTCRVDFDEGRAVVNGSGMVDLKCFSRLVASVNGSGVIRAEDAAESCRINITGSGVVAVRRAANPRVEIAGSGDVELPQIGGAATVKITGSGDVRCAGAVESLKLRVTGSGDLRGEDLTVGEADLLVVGGGEIALRRILQRSVERLDPQATLRVGARGLAK